MNYSIGEKIKQLRKKNKISQNELAENLNVSYQAISKWETGKSQPDITVLPLIAKYFNIFVDELVNYDESDDKQIKELYFQSIYSLLILSIHSRKYGLLSLEQLKSEKQHFIINKGIDYLINGTSSENIRTILENIAKDQNVKLNLSNCIINGICAISKGIDTLELRELLISFCPVYYKSEIKEKISKTNEFDTVTFERSLCQRKESKIPFMNFVIDLNDYQIQTLIKKCEYTTIAAALNGAGGDVCRKVLKNVSLKYKEILLFKMINSIFTDDQIKSQQKKIYDLYQSVTCSFNT